MRSYKRESSDSFYIQRCGNNIRTDGAEDTKNESENNENDNSCRNDDKNKNNKNEECEREEVINGSDDKNKNDDGCNNEALYLFHYPNLCVNRYGRWMDTNIVWPDGVDKCIVEFEWFVNKDFAGNSDYIDEAIAQSETVQMEDVALCNRCARTYLHYYVHDVSSKSVYRIFMHSILSILYITSTGYSHI